MFVGTYREYAAQLFNEKDETQCDKSKKDHDDLDENIGLSIARLESEAALDEVFEKHDRSRVQPDRQSASGRRNFTAY